MCRPPNVYRLREEGTILGLAGYEHSQRQTVRRPSLDILLVLTRVNRGWGASQIRVCALCGSTQPLWLELLARQRVRSWTLGSWMCAHMETSSQDLRGGGGKEDMRSTCSVGGGLDLALIELSDGGDVTLFSGSQRPVGRLVLVSRKPCLVGV